MTKAQKIRNFANNNTSATPQEIADACGVTRIYVYQVLHKMKNKKIKTIKSMKPVVSKNGTPTDGQKVLREELDRLHAEIANLEILEEVNEKLLIDYEAEIEQLESDIIGYRAVISYLQGRLDGATV